MYESTADLNEQVYYERLDADLLQAQYEAESAEAAAQRARGICGHSSSRLGRKVPAVYSAEDVAAMLAAGPFKNREGFAGSQADIPAGRDLCTECGALVEEWVF